MPLVPCYRGSVNAWECDENAHLNVRFYLGKANQGLPTLLQRAGVPPAVQPRIRVQHARFLREARQGVPLTVFAGFVTASQVYSEVRHTGTGEPLATIVTDLAGELALPKDAPRCTIPEHGAPRGIDAAAAALRPDYGSIGAMGFTEIGRGQIAPWECDAAGELEAFQYVGRMSDSVINLIAGFQTEEELSRRSNGVEGGALVELRIAFHAPLRVGSTFTIHSGVAAVGRKTQHFVHLFFDEGSRACVASAEGIAIAMDLKARRAIELPEERRRRIEARLLRLPR